MNAAMMTIMKVSAISIRPIGVICSSPGFVIATKLESLTKQRFSCPHAGFFQLGNQQRALTALLRAALVRLDYFFEDEARAAKVVSYPKRRSALRSRFGVKRLIQVGKLGSELLQ